MKKVFIGYTSSQDILFRVSKNSIERRSNGVKCFPIIQSALRELGIYSRDQDKLGTTEFSITRFLTPWLAGYDGWVLFCDNDTLALEDINTLFKLTDDRYALMCAKHNHQPTNAIKLNDQPQSVYPRKNWSSVVLWNCNHPKNKIITPDYVNEASPMHLHRFLWLDDDDIGEFSHEWNWLVDWYDSSSDGEPKLLHYTDGGPYFKNYQNCSYSKEWLAEYELLIGKKFTNKDIIDA